MSAGRSRAAEIVVAGVGRTFQTSRGAHEVLAGIDLTVRPGEVVALLGASGSGKSTLLRLAGGLDRPSVGSVRIDGVPVRGVDARTAFVFQEARLLPWRSLAANVALGLPRTIDRATGRARVRELLAEVQLQDFADHRPRGVSGGMAQRVALARALARSPGVLLLDEPFGALDALTRLRMQNLLLDLLQEEPTTVLLVTHDVEESLVLADRVAVLGPDAERPALGARIVHELRVPVPRPRDRGDPRIADLRADLLERLGVPRRPSTTPEEEIHEAHEVPPGSVRNRRAAAVGLRGRGR